MRCLALPRQRCRAAVGKETSASVVWSLFPCTGGSRCGPGPRRGGGGGGGGEGGGGGGEGKEGEGGKGGGGAA